MKGEKATYILAEAIKEKLDKSGLSARKFFTLSKDAGFHVHYSYMLSGKRGLTFGRAVRIANYLGIDLGKIQRICK